MHFLIGLLIGLIAGGVIVYFYYGDLIDAGKQALSALHKVENEFKKL